MTHIVPTAADGAPLDNVTDDQMAAMEQAMRQAGDAPWSGDMAAALECCDRGWLSAAHGALAQDARAGLFYLITVSGAAVVFRERNRRATA